jgi:hypothetical protein
MVVPMPRRRNDHVPALQGHLLTLNCREALAIDDEAACERNVSMCRRGFTGFYYLQTTVDCVGRVWRC